MNSLFRRHQRVLFFVRHKSRNSIKPKKPTKDALPPDVSTKITLWKDLLRKEIDARLSITSELKNLSFKKFYVDPQLGNILEVSRPRNSTINVNFRPGAWIDILIDGRQSPGFIASMNDDSMQLRIMDLPPSTIYDNPLISIAVPDDRAVFDFLLEFWENDNWRDSPGCKTFLKAHRVLPFTSGKPRRRVDFVNQNLNEGQMHAVRLALHPEQFLLSIQGPPGTGKTDVVAEIIMQYFRKKKRVLVMAPANKAVDNVASRVYNLIHQNEKHFQLLNADATRFSIHDAISSHKNFESLEMACNLGSNFWEHEELGPEHADEARKLHERICADLIGNANVIYSTLTAGSVRKLKRRDFHPDLVIIDEASQASEPLGWYAAMQAPKAILVGDQNQLGAIFLGTQKLNCDNSAMAYLEREFGSKVQTRLQIQYRSNEKIMKWSSDVFYEGELKADESVRNIHLNDIIVPTDECYTDPLILIDTFNAGGCHEIPVHTSFKNRGEAKIVATQVRALLASGLDVAQLGVITPYKVQSELIKKLLEDIPGLTVSSVDAFQGQEREVICMSLVRSRKGDIYLGFLNDIRRMNVSITRAKRQFFLVANSATLQEHEELRKLLNEISTNGRIVKLADLKRDNRQESRR